MRQLLRTPLALATTLATACRCPEGPGRVPDAWASRAGGQAAELISDFDGNGVEDALDIADGTLLDEDLNGIPDIAEQ